MKNKTLLSALLLSGISLNSLQAQEAPKMCEKGQNMLKVTLRAFEGAACDIGVLAYWAEANCQKAEGYSNSKCHSRATKALEKRNLLDKGAFKVMGYDKQSLIVQPSDIAHAVKKAKDDGLLTEDEWKQWQQIKGDFPASK